MRIPRQALIKMCPDYPTAKALLEKCQLHPTNGTVYNFFVTNNLSQSREVWGVYARPVGIEKFKENELII
jgi:hypothetical protein